MQYMLILSYAIKLKDGKLSMNDNQEEYYKRNYNCVFDYVHNRGETQYVCDLTDKVCRFCGKRYPEVKFKKKAHAISEMLGNKEFVLKNECDICNSFFGKHLEDNLGKYLGLGRTLSQIFGKEGVPSYKTKDEKCRIDFTEKGLVIQIKEDSDFIEQHSNYITFHAIRDTYIPIAVYKALVKMALSLINYEQMPLFNDTVNWIKETEQVNSKHNMGNYEYIIEKYVPGNTPMQLRARGFIRKYDIIMAPYYQFILEFSNYSYQIIVPCKIKDTHLLGSTVDFIPIYGSYKSEFATSTKLVPMSGKEKVKGETIDICLGFKKNEMHAGNGKNIDDFFKEEGINLKKRLK